VLRSCDAHVLTARTCRWRWRLDVARCGRPTRATSAGTLVVLHGDGLADERCAEPAGRGLALRTVGTVLRWDGGGRLEVGLPQDGWPAVVLDALTACRP